MPPRLPTQSLCSDTSLSWSSRAWQASQSSVPTSSPSLSRPFSATASRPRRTSGRSKIFMERWRGKEGQNLKNHTPGTPNYLARSTNRPFPTNPAFMSQPVLAEQSRELIWERFMKQGEPVKTISAEFGVDQRRVVAVVRMKEVEKDWIAKVCSHFSQSSLRPAHPFSMMIL